MSNFRCGKKIFLSNGWNEDHPFILHGILFQDILKCFSCSTQLLSVPLEKMLMLSSPETFSLQFKFVAYGFLLPCDGSSLAVIRHDFSVLCSQGWKVFWVSPPVHFPSNNELPDMLMVAPSSPFVISSVTQKYREKAHAAIFWVVYNIFSASEPLIFSQWSQSFSLSRENQRLCNRLGFLSYSFADHLCAVQFPTEILT